MISFKDNLILYNVIIFRYSLNNISKKIPLCFKFGHFGRVIQQKIDYSWISLGFLFMKTNFTGSGKV